MGAGALAHVAHNVELAHVDRGLADLGHLIGPRPRHPREGHRERRRGEGAVVGGDRARVGRGAQRGRHAAPVGALVAVIAGDLHGGINEKCAQKYRKSRARHAGAPRRACRADRDRERDDRRDQRTWLVVVVPDEGENERNHQDERRQSRRQPGAPQLPRLGAHEQQHDHRARQHRGAEQAVVERRLALILRAEAERHRDLADAHRQRKVVDPPRRVRLVGDRCGISVPSTTTSTATATTSPALRRRYSSKQRLAPRPGSPRSTGSAAPAPRTPSTRRGPARDPVRQARAKNSSDAAQSATSSMYSRASCEYQIMNGLTATSAAANRPARRETSSRPAQVHAAGPVAVPRTADSERRPPRRSRTRAPTATPTTKYSGGFGSLALQVLSIAPSDSRSSWTAWASSNQKLWRVSVAKRSAAPTITSTPTISQSASGRIRSFAPGADVATAPGGELRSTLYSSRDSSGRSSAPSTLD